MFWRKILDNLEEWANSVQRKPLVLRGARQVGKTTAVDLFSAKFDYILKFNLERKADLKLFQDHADIDSLVPALFFNRGIPMGQARTLIFIDEIHNSPSAVANLRYFYEEYPQYYVIAAGSLLDTLIDKKIHFPVGRVDFRVIRPVSFNEFLHASHEEQALEALATIPFPAYAHDPLMKMLRTYTFIGGMPAVMVKYMEINDMVKLRPIYDSLLASYLDDVEKYAPSDRFVQILRFIIKQSFYFASFRITFQGFGKSTYNSRDVGNAFRLLEKAMLLSLVYPSVETSQPLIPDIRKSPRLQMVDTGLVNFMAGLQENLFGNQLLSDIYGGRMAEHLTGQELLSLTTGTLNRLDFWVREKRQSQAEVDFVVAYKGLAIPVEVKSNKAGQLRSLHQYMEAAPHAIAVRVYSGQLSLEDHHTPGGKRYRLLSLPFYLVHRIYDYLDWMM
ncbi:MAG: ATP-binding protein [Bacteroidales bacterium]|nr:ATP-binding protein [Bacteroidales bacterium]